MSTRGAPAGEKTARCRSCGREKRIPVPSDGHPYGWYYLTVGVPTWFNSGSGKPYRAIGLYCSADCLEAGISDLRREEDRHRHAYEHE